MKKRAIRLVGILLLIILVSIACINFRLSNQNASSKEIINKTKIPNQSFEMNNSADCVSDEDCVPAQCCHPTTCANSQSKGVCNLLCTQDCVPGSLDCGQGSCKCINKKCSAVLNQ
ncbi:Uncharacterised protein [uncultured archaeon]|nr:Uncharacterised protein [uncultured archaeon]